MIPGGYGRVRPTPHPSRKSSSRRPASCSRHACTAAHYTIRPICLASQGPALVALSIYDESVLDPIAALVADSFRSSLTDQAFDLQQTLEYPSRL